MSSLSAAAISGDVMCTVTSCRAISALATVVLWAGRTHPPPGVPVAAPCSLLDRSADRGGGSFSRDCECLARGPPPDTDGNRAPYFSFHHTCLIGRRSPEWIWLDRATV